MRTWKKCTLAALMAAALLRSEVAGHAQTVTFKPYIQPGDATTFAAPDVMVVAWQTSETAPSAAYSVTVTGPGAFSKAFAPTGRVVDNYLSADPQFSGLALPRPYGAHVDYFTPLTGLAYNTAYTYTVTGPGLPAGGFNGGFHTRKTGSQFSFEVQGDEGYYPNAAPGPNFSPNVVDYEARIIREMYDVASLNVPGIAAPLPAPDLALNTGDNVYITGSDGNYKDVWFNNWNSDADSNDAGAPFLRGIPLYIVVGNHDVGGGGNSANLLADTGATVPGNNGPGPFGGGVGGGDAMAHFSNFYDPLNGPTGVDIQYTFSADSVFDKGFFFQYNNVNYTSPAAIDAVRASTAVDYGTGKGPQRQIDHESNYSFDYGNAHFVFLDANPHLFNQLADNAKVPTFPFTPYPGVLRRWLINDLDSSAQPWKVIVFHQPAFSSGNATVNNDQFRRVAKFFEDHGANLVFNGHEHNYQRTLPLRVLPGATLPSSETAPDAVAVDTAFNGATNTVPDGVLYMVEGAGGNRDFDDNLPNPRGGGASIDQDDAQPAPSGPASWLDTHLTDNAMTLPNAGGGTKITAKFKSKVFSFADITVSGNSLTLYQITEPLAATTSGLYGTDYLGRPLGDPLPDTVLNLSNPTNPTVVQTAGAGGTPALLDVFTVTKPSVAPAVTAALTAPAAAAPGGPVAYTVSVANTGTVALNGTQAVLALPTGVTLTNPTGDALTLQGQSVVVTLGRLAPGQTLYAQVRGQVAGGVAVGTRLTASVAVRSSTAQTVTGGTATTQVARLRTAPAAF